MKRTSEADIRLAVHRYIADTKPETRNELLQAVLNYYNPPLLPLNRCYKCGNTDEDNFRDVGYPLVDFRVVACYEEEGYSNIEKWVCGEHLDWLIDEFQRLGFVSHHHGNGTLLEDQRCPGYMVYGDCPTPKGYGEQDIEDE